MLLQAQVSEWERSCFKWAVMFPSDLPGHKTKPEQESPSASIPTKERLFASLLFACVKLTHACVTVGHSRVFVKLCFKDGE